MFKRFFKTVTPELFLALGGFIFLWLLVGAVGLMAFIPISEFVPMGIAMAFLLWMVVFEVAIIRKNNPKKTDIIEKK